MSSVVKLKKKVINIVKFVNLSIIDLIEIEAFF